MINAILLDLDGVVCNFVRSAAIVHGRDEKHLLANWTKGVWDMELILGITTNEFFGKIEDAGAAYWADMQMYDYADELFELCKSYAKTYICTAPTLASSSSSGKVDFLKKWKGKHFRDYVITPQKHLLAKPDHLLIDDSDKNIEKFSEYGGKTILFPNFFNSNHEFTDRQMEYVKNQLSSICEQ